MKHPGILFSSLLLFVFIPFATGQESQNVSSKQQFGVVFSSFGNHELYQKDALIGSPGIDGENHFTLGLNYLYQLNNWADFESGLEFSQYKYMVDARGPFSSGRLFSTQASLLTIPVVLRANFLNYFFVNSGLMVNMPISSGDYIEDQTGIGGIIGLGVQYTHYSGISLFANPYVKRYSLHSMFSSENKPSLIDGAVKFGIMYGF